MKLTKTQVAALTTIHENPGQVVAYLRRLNMLTIHGNTETQLVKKGLITTVAIDRTANSTGNKAGTVQVYAWELTASGREALGIENEPEQEQTKTEQVAEGKQVTDLDEIFTKVREALRREEDIS